MPIANLSLQQGRQIVYRLLNNKRYEHKDHLGNVVANYSDKLTAAITGNATTNSITFTTYKAEQKSMYNYYAFGMPKPNTYTAGVLTASDEWYDFGDNTFNQTLALGSGGGFKYRYGFNGKEKDNEVMGDGNFQDYGFRMYNTRLGRFISVDPLTSDYPHWTPYQFAGNMPVKYVDLDGCEPAEPDQTSQGRISSQGVGLNSNTTAGTEQISSGLGITYKKTFGDNQGLNATLFAGARAGIGIRQNGTQANGLYTSSNFNIQAGYKKVSIGFSAEPRINTGAFSRQSNISSSFILNAGRFQATVGNDYFFSLASGGRGYNGEHNFWGSTDGGLTMLVNALFYSKDNSTAFGIGFNGYTPHRPDFATENNDVKVGTPGILFNNGTFDNVPNYNGGYRNYVGAVFLKKTDNYSIGINVGMQNDLFRAKAQGAIHNAVGPWPEFPTIYGRNYMYGQIQFNYRLK